MRAFSPGRRSMLIVALVVLLGALGTGLASAALHSSAESWSRRAFAQKQDVIAKIVMAELFQYAVALTDLAASLSAQPEVTASAFATITAPVDSLRLPGATAVGYVVPAAPGDVPATQAEWRRRGSGDLALTLASADPGDHYFPVLGRSLDGGPNPLGTDLSATPEIVQVLRDTRLGNDVEASPAYRAVDGGELGFVMACPVFDQASRFLGWVTVTYRGRDFLGPAIGVIAGDQVGVVFADTSSGTPVTLATWPSPARGDPGQRLRRIGLPVDQPRWLLTVRPTVRLLPATERWLARGAAAIGSVLTVLLATLTATVVTSRDRALRRVGDATAELRRDIARREAVEQQLRVREEELVGFAGVVAHDLRNPLSNVIGYAELIHVADQGALSEKQRGYLTRVRGSAALMQRLIDDLLAYATADNATLRLTEIDLDEVVTGILAEREGAAATAERSALPTVVGDPTLIRQVLDNLIGNAIKYTPPERSAEIRIGAADTGAGYRIEVADRGIGIPEKQRAEVFNAFTRAEGSERYPGTGLGLAIVQRIVDRHGGEVGVGANPGGGSLFWFTLPKPTSGEMGG
ncbi:ATP-binding protein [Actinoplanes sp. NPDC051851]|uniref:ATP-binding protein n=1 Tax=Actinoplanes sp. NPDC051851 TaxID=3154753 RepID=UPI0034399CA5